MVEVRRCIRNASQVKGVSCPRIRTRLESRRRRATQPHRRIKKSVTQRPLYKRVQSIRGDLAPSAYVSGQIHMLNKPQELLTLSPTDIATNSTQLATAAGSKLLLCKVRKGTILFSPLMQLLSHIPSSSRPLLQINKFIRQSKRRTLFLALAKSVANKSCG